MDARARRRRAVVLSLHAALVGAGCFVFTVPALILVGWAREQDAVLPLRPPLWLGVGLAAVGAYYLVPLLWPLHMLIGLREGGLVGGVRRGDRTSLLAARRIFVVQAALLTAVALVLAVLYRGYPVFVVPLAVAGVHLGIGRWLSGTATPPRRPAPTPCTSPRTR